MAQHTFDGPRECPECKASFTAAEQKPEFTPVIVVTCPNCGALLWLPGLEGTALYPFDPDADDSI